MYILCRKCMWMHVWRCIIIVCICICILLCKYIYIHLCIYTYIIYLYIYTYIYIYINVYVCWFKKGLDMHIFLSILIGEKLWSTRLSWWAGHFLTRRVPQKISNLVNITELTGITRVYAEYNQSFCQKPRDEPSSLHQVHLTSSSSGFPSWLNLEA